MRRLGLLLAIALAIAIAVFFADRPGAVTLVWQGWRIDTSLAVLLLLLAVFVIALGLILRVLGALIGAPRRVRLMRREQRRLEGYRVLTRGLVAVAAGDTREAQRLALHSETLFRKGRIASPPLGLLLAAQAAQLKGDATTAEKHFRAMLEAPETEFLGLRGLIVQALKVGDNTTALALTERAQRLQPKSGWVLQARLALEARQGTWRRAGETLGEAVRRGAISSEAGRHHKAALLLARSREAIKDGRPRDALAFAAQAHGFDEAWPPAAAHYARLLHGRDKTAKALRIIEIAWSRAPHPELAESYGALLASEAAPRRVSRFERLVDLRPADPDSHLAVAAVALSARLWGEARRHLEQAGAAGPGPYSAPVCRMMAELEQTERSDAAAARLWLERATRAPTEPTWVCTQCAAETPAWAPLCPSCHSFDALVWQVPDRSAGRPTAVAEVAPAPPLLEGISPPEIRSPIATDPTP
ncbi:MAG TPA: heme biosynthesis HemY N-terminal domain-containing protein [Stellaceae bacterium]|nr:heme biosynthesis HemY N-terminal domain-containing protein [Stellaceae bacterium]